ncbi:hypothetical protein ACFQX7_37865 [Luedemannella flava]
MTETAEKKSDQQHKTDQRMPEQQASSTAMERARTATMARTGAPR